MSENMRGGLWLIVSIFTTTLSNSLIHLPKSLATPMTMLMFKSGVAFLFVTTMMLLKLKQQNDFRTKNLGLHILRGIIGAVGVYLWILALMRLPFAKAVVLSMSSGLFSAFGGYLIFREEVTIRKTLALFIGLGGVLIIISPQLFDAGFNLIDINVLLPILSAICFAGSALITRYVGRSDSSLTTTFYLTLTMFVCASLIIFITDVDYYLKFENYDAFFIYTGLTSIGLGYGISQVLYAKAYRLSEASFLAPLKYLKFPISLLIGGIIFDESIQIPTVMGGGIIIGSALMLYRRKGKR